ATNHWEHRLTRDWSPAIRFSLPDKDVFPIDANNPTSFAATCTAPACFAGVGTVLFDMVTNPVTGTLYVSNTEAHNEVRFEGPGTVAKTVPGAPSPTTVLGHLHKSGITGISVTTVAPRHLNKHIHYIVLPRLP